MEYYARVHYPYSPGGVGYLVCSPTVSVVNPQKCTLVCARRAVTKPLPASQLVLLCNEVFYERNNSASVIQLLTVIWTIL